MSKMNLNRLKDSGKFGATLALFLGMAITSPAQARGIVADFDLPASVPACSSLGQQSCSVADFVAGGLKYDLANSSVDPSTPVNAGVFANVYVYADGIVSIGAPLPPGASLAGGLTAANLGNNYIAPGLSDYYSTVGAHGQVKAALLPDDNGVANELRLYWIFNDPLGNLNMFGVDLSSTTTDGKFNASTGYGTFLSPNGWFTEANFGAPPSCDALCTNDQVGGVYLPGDALVGSSYPGGPNGNINTTFFFTVTTQTATTAVPEPSTWATLALGLMSVGFLVWRKRKRVGFTA